MPLAALSENVRRGVPPDLLAWGSIEVSKGSGRRIKSRYTFRVLEIEKLELGGLLEGALEIPELAVDLSA